jgi:hypothetical protein
MRRAIFHKLGRHAWLAAAGVGVLMVCAAASRGGDDQDAQKRANPPAGARGPAHSAPAPKGQQEQPRPAPGAQREQPRPAPRVSAPPAEPKTQNDPQIDKAPRPGPNVQRPRRTPGGGAAPVTAPQPNRAPRIPGAGGPPREAPKVMTPHPAPTVESAPHPAPGAAGPPSATPQAAHPARETNRPGAAAGRPPAQRVITQRQVPSGETTRQKDGSYSVRTKAGNQYSMRPNGSVRSFQSPRGEAQFRADGSVRTVRSRDITIVHRPLGRNLMVRERADHTVVASYGRGQGYIQRPFSARGHDFIQRTYYGDHGRFTRFYRPYRYHGFGLYVYAPMLYYSPLFYSWAYAPWTFGVAFQWGWMGAPWYPYYGPYFAPYPVYWGGPFWLTDYLLAWALQQDYLDRMAAAADEAAAFTPPCGAGQVALSPEVKQAIADEVRLQLNEASRDSQSAAGNAIPDFSWGEVGRLLSDNKPHVFVVSSSVDVTAGIGECVLTPGDVLQSTGAPPADSQIAYLRVVASKSGDCARGSLVAVSLQDLQDMLNRMREAIDQGVGELRSTQGQGGLPAAPAAALRGDINASYAAAAPPPDPNGAALLNQTERDASAAEQEVLDQAFEEQKPPATSGTIQLGQTVGQVTAILGPPTVVVNLGDRQMYVYPNLKITFTGGRVTDVQ